MEGEVEIVRAELVDPLAMGGGFQTSECAVIPVEIDSVGSFPSSGFPSGGIEEWANRPVDLITEEVLAVELFDGGGSGGFVSVDTSGKINAGSGGGGRSLKPEKRVPVRIAPAGDGKTVLLGELRNVA